MNIGNAINKGIGSIRFHFHTVMRRRKIHFRGIKQYLGKGARLRVSENGKIVFGNKTYVSDRSSIGAHLEGTITIGDNNFFNSNVNIVCFKGITIGDNNLFAQNIVVIDQIHNYKNKEMPIYKQGYIANRVVIGSDCWFCANVVICPGTEIGNHIIVSANSVVKGKLDKPGLYAGNPATLVKEL